MNAVLDADRRATLARLADIVVPRSIRMPSATDISLTSPGGAVDRVLAIRPDLTVPLCELLDQAKNHSGPGEGVAHLSDVALGVLMQSVAGAYYLHPEVRERIGYSGQEAQSLGRGDIGGEELLAVMMERPPRWRRPPDPAGSRAAPHD